jgi:hypothetical protein
MKETATKLVVRTVAPLDERRQYPLCGGDDVIKWGFD